MFYCFVDCVSLALKSPYGERSIKYVCMYVCNLGSFSNDNDDGNENVTNLHIQWAKTIALHALHVLFSFLSISLPSSAKQQREITKFEVLLRTSALGDKISFFSPKLSAARNGFIPEGLPHLCHIKRLGIYVFT